MTKIEWLEAELERAGRGKRDFWVEGVGALKEFVERSGEGLSRSDFWKEFRRLFNDGIGPSGPSDDSLQAWEYFASADFSSAWESQPFMELPRVGNDVLREALEENDFVRIGGKPEWIQWPDTPICPGCERDMALVAEIRSLPTAVATKYPGLEDFMFSDCGSFYLFFCKACGNFDAKCQFY